MLRSLGLNDCRGRLGRKCRNVGVGVLFNEIQFSMFERVTDSSSPYSKSVGRGYGPR